MKLFLVCTVSILPNTYYARPDHLIVIIKYGKNTKITQDSVNDLDLIDFFPIDIIYCINLKVFVKLINGPDHKRTSR